VFVVAECGERVFAALEGIEFGLVGLPLLDQRRVGPGGKHVGDIGVDSSRQGDLAFAVDIHAVAHTGSLRCSSAVLGRKMVRKPSMGRNAQIAKTCTMPIWSASAPSTAAPRAPMPKAKPKTNPEIMPTFPGTSS